MIPAIALMLPILGYVGPGPGLTMLTALFGLLATLAIALGAIAIWPIRMMLRKLRNGRNQPGTADSASN
ncbi:hypothetical protein NG895_18820 [Aeoliella sp. ICT_H6.2]|uniref:Uncharacterized protein n=1 Tax=Aeoliella straminimaris TaxID=2954799 RepID=A0A9X2JHY6_9BACT|nr:hypothetical protein [Aeoliella straminimaris]MCO6045957.1 hypothetical protein [Aeoliella straminimaris]